MSSSLMRRFSSEFKRSAVERVLAGERLIAVADELGIKRMLLYRWRDAYRDFGEAGFNRKRGPKPGAARKAVSDAPPPDELATALARIAELEAKIGRQQMELDFLSRALRLMDKADAPAGQNYGDRITVTVHKILRHSETGSPQWQTLIRYDVAIETAAGNYSAHVPDLPGWVAAGATA
jgi:transposase